MIRAVEIESAVADAIVSHARAEAPLEACGLLSGPNAGGGTAAATRYHPARNALASPTAYDVDPEDLVRIVHDIEGDGEELVGIVHSHPSSPARPSATDVREARYPVPLVIATLLDPTASAIEALRAWVVTVREVREIGLRIVPVSSRASRP
jgi:proteasome lid subunit RPN8/RPN11